MQVWSPLRIKADTREEQILQILLDKHCRAILDTTQKYAKTSSEISSDCNIPLSTVYRRLKLLKDLKFLHVSCTIRSDGKKLSLFQNRTTGIHILLDNNQLQIHTHLSSSGM